MQIGNDTKHLSQQAVLYCRELEETVKTSETLQSERKRITEVAINLQKSLEVRSCSVCTALYLHLKYIFLKSPQILQKTSFSWLADEAAQRV